MYVTNEKVSMLSNMYLPSQSSLTTILQWLGQVYVCVCACVHVCLWFMHASISNKFLDSCNVSQFFKCFSAPVELTHSVHQFKLLHVYECTCTCTCEIVLCTRFKLK